ncbi:siroheme synthase CysG [Pseudorhodoplanes sinuspersici]|uniref:Uroporphyrinogen-III C-methyltransferase n=1 Tax=Pseudorhodoplanes sinuspersici TaxID=1235591 RepID=A0A1W6ZX92_9HYPH|nr:siroheme synthase CysG [Pseudorhodoplanes sinuspersici]ARQ01936.1 uroporphyrinogen-III C-methyltransferase [Pseudorhodoplanes sinuspersici]RKE73708.1 uroporphyrinogen-III C-methyltransferase [Pseudorhodoplanes sinuspersici]
MRFLPLFFDLTTGPVILVGSGPQALAKLRILQAAGADIRWHVLSGDDIEGADGAETKIGLPADEDFLGAVALVASAGKEIDERLASRARSMNLPVNIVDRPDLSTFIFPAIVDRGDVVVAVGTGGASPVLARRLREKIEEILPERIGEFASMMGRYRERLAALRHRGFSTRRFWERVIDGPIGAQFLAGRTAKAEAALIIEIDRAGTDRPAQGHVSIVGAGPGDPDLLTLKALHALQSSDIVFYDDLVSPAILGRIRRDAEQVFVGKRKGHPGIGQSEINRRLIEAAKAGLNVVRLKGGDPFIFGRGGEEREVLEAAGIAVTIVPGITAALGCAAEAGLPLTLRKEATRLSIVTANTAEGADNIDWSGLADRTTTVAIYMGLTAASAVKSGLIAAGRDPNTPVAVLARGTRPDSRSITGTLSQLPMLAASVGDGPALIVVGDVVAHSQVWKEAVELLEAAE